MGDLVIVGACCALICAAIYVSSVAYRYFIGHEFVAVSRDVVWMSPLAYMLFFTIAAVPLTLASRLVARRRALQFGTTVLVTCAVFSLFLPHTQIARSAALILALGVAVVVSRAVASSPQRWLPAMRRITLGLAAAFFVMSAVSLATRAQATRQALARLPEARPGAPNVLLVVLDCVRASALRIHGYERRTAPGLTRLAAEATVFDLAIATSPWTLPSHATLFTGHYPALLDVGVRQPLDGTYPTVAERFRDRGYETAAFTANLHYTGWDSGLDRGFIRYSDFARSFQQLLRSSTIGQTEVALDLYEAESLADAWRTVRAGNLYVNPKPEGHRRDSRMLTDDFLRWYRARQQRPFFVFMNYYDAHNDYNPADDLRRVFATEPGERDLYDAAIRTMDREIGRVLDALRSKGELDSTIVVITSDHGELFGEYGLKRHGNSVYLELLHVPLLLRYPPAVPANHRVSDPVSLRDVPATVLSLAELPVGSIPGKPLSALWENDSAEASPVFAQLGRVVQLSPSVPASDDGYQTVFDDEWQYIREVQSGREELYRYRVDRAARRNLAGTAEGSSVLLRLRSLMRTAVATHMLADRRE